MTLACSCRAARVAQITSAVSAIDEEEKDRNRHRVLEINTFFSESKQELDLLDEMARN